jgi:hypothetical protein
MMEHTEPTQEQLAEMRLKTTMWNAAMEHAAKSLEDQRTVLTSGKTKHVQNFQQAAVHVRSLMVTDV